MGLIRDLPTVVMSIETVARELEGKLVVAAALANNGCRVFVGHKEDAQEVARLSRRVIWLGKSVYNHASPETSTVLDLQRNESSIVYHHDEGAIFPERTWATYLLRYHPTELFERTERLRVCVWGEKQRDTLTSHAPGLTDRVSVTGSPRFDLCAPDFAWMQEEIALDERVRAGYILVNTQFHPAMHTEGPENTFRKALASTEWPEGVGHREIVDLWFSRWSRSTHELADFVVLVKELAFRYPDRTIILRPHPSESITFYQTAFSSFGNVKVRRDLSVLQWIRGASLVVHCECTTGIEAVLAGRPVLHFLADRDGDRDVGKVVAKEAGCTVRTVSEAMQKADELLTGDLPKQSWSASAIAILNNLITPATPLLVEETLRVVKEHGMSSSDFRLPKEERRRWPLSALRPRPTQPGGYIGSKRGPLDRVAIEALVAGCDAHGVGRAVVSHLTDKYVVLEPS
jgi:surface carbohydrate biosynthesis protein